MVLVLWLQFRELPCPTVKPRLPLDRWTESIMDFLSARLSAGDTGLIVVNLILHSRSLDLPWQIFRYLGGDEVRISVKEELARANSIYYRQSWIHLISFWNNLIWAIYLLAIRTRPNNWSFRHRFDLWEVYGGSHSLGLDQTQALCSIGRREKIQLHFHYNWTRYLQGMSRVIRSEARVSNFFVTIWLYRCTLSLHGGKPCQGSLPF